MITVVYPYMAQLAQGDELKYSIRSLCQYLQFDFDVVIVGDKPDWYIGKHITTSKVRGMTGAKALDIANKLRIISESDIISDDFIYSYDDIYLLKECTYGQINKVIALGWADRKSRMKDGSVIYKRIFEETVRTIDQDEFYVYETHLPRIINKKKLKLLLKSYELHKRLLLFSTLYFNEFAEKPDIILNEKNEIKANVNNKLSTQSIEQICVNKLWLNNSENAWCDALNNYLKNRFNKKCKFEVQ